MLPGLGAGKRLPLAPNFPPSYLIQSDLDTMIGLMGAPYLHGICQVLGFGPTYSPGARKKRSVAGFAALLLLGACFWVQGHYGFCSLHGRHIVVIFVVADLWWRGTSTKCSSKWRG